MDLLGVAKELLSGAEQWNGSALQCGGTAWKRIAKEMQSVAREKLRKALSGGAMETKCLVGQGNGFAKTS